MNSTNQPATTVRDHTAQSEMSEAQTQPVVSSSTGTTSSHDVQARHTILRKILSDAADAQSKADGAFSSVSNRLLTTAKLFQASATIGKVDKINAARFINACDLEEKWLKSAEAGNLQRDKLPRCWTLAKSNIKAAMNLGLDLSKFNTEHALREKVTEVRQAAAQDPITDELKAFKKALAALPTEQALEVLAQANSFVDAILQELVPVQPIPPTTEEQQVSN